MTQHNAIRHDESNSLPKQESQREMIELALITMLGLYGAFSLVVGSFLILVAGGINMPVDEEPSGAYYAMVLATLFFNCFSSFVWIISCYSIRRGKAALPRLSLLCLLILSITQVAEALYLAFLGLLEAGLFSGFNLVVIQKYLPRLMVQCALIVLLLNYLKSCSRTKQEKNNVVANDHPIADEEGAAS